MTLPHLTADYIYCVEELDFAYEGWREDSSILITIKHHGLRDTLAMSFFEAQPSWMDDCVPAAIKFQIEWLANLFGDTSGNEFVEETQHQIFRYIGGAVVSNLLHWESNFDCGVDYD